MSGCWQQEGGACEKSDADRVQAAGCSQHLTLTHFFFAHRMSPRPDGEEGFKPRLSCRRCAESNDGQSALYFARSRRPQGGRDQKRLPAWRLARARAPNKPRNDTLPFVFTPSPQRPPEKG